MAKNKINGKAYIGQTIRYMHDRRSSHNLAAEKCTDNTTFHRAIRKYGRAAFEWHYLEKGIFEIEELNRLEIEYIKQYNTIAPHGYNLQHGGANGFHSEATKRKMSAARMGRIGNNNPMMHIDSLVSLGRIRVARENNNRITLRNSMRIVNGMMATDRHKCITCKVKYRAMVNNPIYIERKHINYAMANKKRMENATIRYKQEIIWDKMREEANGGHGVRCIDTGISYKSIRQAARAAHCYPKEIRSICNGVGKTIKGLRYEYT